jgi:hypothetical protein
VLEHVENPNILLDKLNSILADNGKAFISTCVNCPTIDHVYHYKSIGEIQRMIKNSGFLINDERILPVENLEMEDIVEKKIAINYSAIISRQK